MSSKIASRFLAFVDDPEVLECVAGIVKKPLADDLGTLPSERIQREWLKNAPADRASYIAEHTSSSEIIDLLIAKEQRKGVTLALSKNKHLSDKQASELLDKGMSMFLNDAPSNIQDSIGAFRFFQVAEPKLSSCKDLSSNYALRRLAETVFSRCSVQTPAHFRSALEFYAGKGDSWESRSRRARLFNAACFRGSRVSTKALLELRASLEPSERNASGPSSADSELCRRVFKGDDHFKEELLKLHSSSLTSEFLSLVAENTPEDLFKWASFVGPNFSSAILRILEKTLVPADEKMAGLFLEWDLTIDKWVNSRITLTQAAAVKTAIEYLGFFSYSNPLIYITDPLLLAQTLSSMDAEKRKGFGRVLRMGELISAWKSGLEPEKVFDLLPGIFAMGGHKHALTPEFKTFLAENSPYLSRDALSSMSRKDLKKVVRRLVEGKISTPIQSDMLSWMLVSLPISKHDKFEILKAHLVPLEGLLNAFVLGSLLPGQFKELYATLPQEARVKVDQQVGSLLWQLSSDAPALDDALDVIPALVSKLNSSTTDRALVRRFEQDFGSDVKAWQTAFSLMENWQGTLPELLDASKALS